MEIAIDRERLAKTFTTLCEIDSPSQKEGNISKYLKEKFTALGADTIYEDDSAGKTGSESGNLIIRFNSRGGTGKGLFFCCHMDTVEPGTGVEVTRDGDIFTSKGDTILGGDDKSGIAAIIEMLEVLRETGMAHPTIEVILTTCEEIGLLGAKHLDYDQIQTPYGYALDSSGINHVVVQAPAANKIDVEVKGLAAHAGLCPENGINALALAAEALHNLKLGRLDAESSCNFGVIEGGVAANIIPEKVVLRGEVRSHSAEKLKNYTDTITATFEKTISGWQGDEHTGEHRPTVSINIDDDYPALKLKQDEPVIARVSKGALLAGKELKYIQAGGGSDANIMTGRNLPTAIIATGMSKVHTLEEQVDLNDLVVLTELLCGIAVAETGE
ncbi:M20/M25/M40 family metallo-hydrolase [Desulforhopalus singaporensis]|uniref:Peptidase T-like protein n=1 Tax=Desulforhopalus singaporensis TaxID=91360 RepID=A0A1H0S8I4_9BACT|nr:M20/M25/M40 family metallo-hydrolase [Desulforhopalus singaporensis]SDP37809.1 peptidase T-like protein [Desulforhopalus singaporensis]